MRSAALALIFHLVLLQAWAQEQDPPAESAAGPSLKFQIETRFMTRERVVDWSNAVEQESASGQPVVVRIQGDNFLLKVTLTGFAQDKTTVLLVAQTEVLFQDGQRRALSKSLQSQQIRLGTPIMYYPMGKDRKSSEGHTMEMEILVMGHDTGAEPLP